MKFAAIAIIAVGIAAAGSASAANRVTDVEFLKANRCKGLATTLTGVVDVSAIDAYIKSVQGARAPYVFDRADTEFDRARREARSDDRKARLTAELTTECAAYLGDPASVAKR